MKKIKSTLALLLLGISVSANAQILIDGDSADTGSNLGSTPLQTAYGDISFTGEFVGDCTDDDFLAAGASGNCFDHEGSPGEAYFDFDFEVCGVTFIYGGNAGDISVEARSPGGAVLDSFFQESTGGGESAGPETLSANGIGRLAWYETDGSYAPLDNIMVEPCEMSAAPIPSGSPWSLLLLLVLVTGVAIPVLRRAT